MIMRVITEHLSAVVTMAEFEAGVGDNYPKLFVVGEDYTFFKRTKLDEGGFCLMKVKEIPVVPGGEVQERINNLPGGKIPFDFLNQIVSFFKKVMEVNFGGSTSRVGSDCEAMAHILWNKEEKKYEIGIPTQTVGKASVSYTFDDIDSTKHVIIVDIHSHKYCATLR